MTQEERAAKRAGGITWVRCLLEDDFREVAAEATAAEREACAKVAESFGTEPKDDAPYLAKAISTAIRARGKP